MRFQTARVAVMGSLPGGLRTRDPNGIRARFAASENFGGPAASEKTLLANGEKGDGGNQRAEGRKERSPILFAHHFERDQENVACQFADAAGFTVNAGEAGAESVEEFEFVACAVNFREGGADGRKRVGVAAAEGDFAPAGGECGGGFVLLGEHVAVLR